MASEEGNEGKDFALEEKQKQEFEEAMLKLINDSSTTTVVYNNFTYNITKDEKENSAEIKVGGTTIARIENGEFSYNIQGLENLKRSLENNKSRPAGNYKDLGLPDLEYLEYLEKEKQRADKELQGEESENTDEEREKDDRDNPDELKQEDDEIEIEERLDEDDNNNKSKNQSNIAKKSGWVKLNKNAKITENKNLAEILKAEEYSEIWVAPTADYSTFQVIGEKENGEYEELNQLERTEGHNPTQNITTLNPENKDNVDSQQVNMMLKLKDKENEGISIARGSMGNTEVSYFRKIPGYDAYISTEVPVAGRDSELDKITPETKYYMSPEYVSRNRT